MTHFVMLGVKEAFKMVDELKPFSVNNFSKKLNALSKKDPNNSIVEELVVFVENEEVKWGIKEYISIRKLSIFEGNEDQLKNMLLGKVEEKLREKEEAEE